MYIDDCFSLTLSKTKFGCRLGGRLINHIAYADDLSILIMLPCKMQKILNICEKYASDHDIMYNCRKGLTMLFKHKKLNDLNSPSLYLCNNRLDYVDNCRDLGIKIENYSCKSDMKRQLCKF